MTEESVFWENVASQYSIPGTAVMACKFKPLVVLSHVSKAKGVLFFPIQSVMAPELTAESYFKQ